MRLSLVYLKGGLGNQLFQLAFANHIKSKRHKIENRNRNSISRPRHQGWQIDTFLPGTQKD